MSSTQFSMDEDQLYRLSRNIDSLNHRLGSIESSLQLLALLKCLEEAENIRPSQSYLEPPHRISSGVFKKIIRSKITEMASKITGDHL